MHLSRLASHQLCFPLFTHDVEGATLEARSTANHCGGTPLLSDWRAWAVELDEIDGLLVLVPVVRVSTRPCQLWRGVVRSAG